MDLKVPAQLTNHVRVMVEFLPCWNFYIIVLDIKITVSLAQNDCGPCKVAFSGLRDREARMDDYSGPS